VAPRSAAAMKAGVIRLWRARSNPRLETLAARVEHLEAELEGLQDAVYRQAVLEQENIGELRRRTEPGQLARDLGQDAERRGL
jgi:hypothetical protein